MPTYSLNRSVVTVNDPWLQALLPQIPVLHHHLCASAAPKIQNKNKHEQLSPHLTFYTRKDSFA